MEKSRYNVLCESNACFRCHSAILNRNNRMFDACINDTHFNINERFLTSEKYDENYLNYALKLGNLYAVNKLLNIGGIRLSYEEKEEAIKLLAINKRYLLAIKTIKKLEGRKVPIMNCISTIKSNDYNEVFKRR